MFVEITNTHQDATTYADSYLQTFADYDIGRFMQAPVCIGLNC